MEAEPSFEPVLLGTSDRKEDDYGDIWESVSSPTTAGSRERSRALNGGTNHRRDGAQGEVESFPDLRQAYHEEMVGWTFITVRLAGSLEDKNEK